MEQKPAHGKHRSPAGPERVRPHSVYSPCYVRNLWETGNISMTQGRGHVGGVKKKVGQRPSPSPHTHQPGKEPKEMTPGDLTCPQVNISGHNEHQTESTSHTNLSFSQHVCMNLTAGNCSQHNWVGVIPHGVEGHWPCRGTLSWPG